MNEKSNKKVNNLIDISMDNLNRLADVNMVIGTPIFHRADARLFLFQKLRSDIYPAAVILARRKSLKKMRQCPLRVAAVP